MVNLSKKGISLIVLVITIIVMIILAGAIILSLQSSGIIGKANEAKTKSDAANAKEYVATLAAEWELNPVAGQTFQQYANARLVEKGYDKNGVVVGSNGEVYAGLTESAMDIVKANVPIGTPVAANSYTLQSKSFTTTGKERSGKDQSGNPVNGAAQTLNTDTSITWKYAGIGEDGKALIVSDMANTAIPNNMKMTLGYEGGYLYGPEVLDEMCDKLYSVAGKGKARNMKIEDVTRILNYTGSKGGYYDPVNYDYQETGEPMTLESIVANKGENRFDDSQSKIPVKSNEWRTNGNWDDIKEYRSDYYYISKSSNKITSSQVAKDLIYPANSSYYYWLSSPCGFANFIGGGAEFNVRCVNSSTVSAYDMFDSDGYTRYTTYALRPVVSLESNVTCTYEGGELRLS